MWCVGSHLVLIPWALGGTRMWGQAASFILSVVSLSLAMWPRSYTAEYTAAHPFRLIMWPKLIKFPIFWLGLSLLVLIVIQALNPAWKYKSDGTVFWMQGIPHQEWLPQGVQAPFEKWNQWRILLIYSSAWMTACAVWVGLTRRSSLRTLLLALAINGLVLTACGVAQKTFGNGKIFWAVTSPNPQFFATFIYKNHAGAYLNLLLAVTWGMAGWYYLRGLRRMDKSDPSILLAFFALCIGAGVFVSEARGATLVMLVFTAAMFLSFGALQFRLPKGGRQPLVSALLLIIVAGSFYPALKSLGSSSILVRLNDGITRQDPSLKWREQATQASLEMLRENWTHGVGAGAFRYLFPTYQHRHPELVTRFGKRLFWEHAHNDVVQFPIELGITGTLLLLACGGYLLIAGARHFFWTSPVCLSASGMLALLVLYAWWDFPFQNPAIIVTATCLAVITLAWAKTGDFGGGD